MKLFLTEKDAIDVTGLERCKLFSHQRRKKSITELVGKSLPAGSSMLDAGSASDVIFVEQSFHRNLDI